MIEDHCQSSRNAQIGVNISYLSGPSDESLRHETLGHALRIAAAERPDAESVVSVHENIRLSFRELDREADRLAAGLLAAGLQRGDRIGIWAPNCVSWLVLQFATARAGLILVTFNTAYRQSELAYVLRKVGCKALVLASGFKDISYPTVLAGIDAPDLQLRIVIDGPVPDGYRSLADIMALADDSSLALLATVEADNQFDDIVNIQFTSGTTGSPKGVMLSHHNLVNNGYFVGLRTGMVAGDRLCVPVPLFHCFGMVMANMAAITHGATLVYPAASFDAGETLRAVEAEKCTLLYGVPTMYIAELNHPDFARFDLSTLRGGIMAGSPCPIDVMRRVRETMHMLDVTIAYGMTETSPVSLQTRTTDSIEQRVETVGTVGPHLEVKIIDPTGRIVPRGSEGELCTRGYSVMRGYWQEEQATRLVLDPAGWVHSGDMARMDDRGFVRITGRIKDLIIRGGENIAPREIEELLYLHPDIVDVQVFGIPDAMFGEAVCAWVILTGSSIVTEEALRDFCRARIAHYKVPKHIRFVSTFPSTASGKVQKFRLREAMAAEVAE